MTQPKDDLARELARRRVFHSSLCDAAREARLACVCRYEERVDSLARDYEAVRDEGRRETHALRDGLDRAERERECETRKIGRGLTWHAMLDAVAEDARAEGRRMGLDEERRRIISAVEEAIGRGVVDGGQYRADIQSAINMALADARVQGQGALLPEAAAVLDDVEAECRKTNPVSPAERAWSAAGYTRLGKTP